MKEIRYVRRNGVRSWLDAHNAVSVIALPFHLMITYSGLIFFCFTYMPLVVAGSYGAGAYFWANRLLPADLAGRAGWEVHTLFIAWAAMLVYPLFCPLRRAWRDEFALAGALFAGLPVLNALTTDRALVASLAAKDWIFAGFDLTTLALGAVFGVIAWRLRYAPRAAASTANTAVDVDLRTTEPEAA